MGQGRHSHKKSYVYQYMARYSHKPPYVCLCRRRCIGLWLSLMVLLWGGLWMQLNSHTVHASTEWAIYDESLYYEISPQDQVIIKSARASVTSVDIPAEIEGCPVVEIEGYAFKDCTRLTAVQLPDSIQKIGEFAFKDCTRLETLEIPDTVKKIGWGAVQGTPWLANQTEPFVIAGQGILLAYTGTETAVTVPAGVRAIGGYAFDSCTTLETVQLPDTLRSVDAFAFINCQALTSVTLPEGLTYIGEYAFHWCTALRQIVLPDTVTTVSGQAFSYCKSLQSAKLSASMTQISNGLFRGCTSLESVTLPDGIQRIYSYAFADCTALKTLWLPESVQEIGMKVFDGCDALQKVTFCNADCAIYDEADTIQVRAKIYGMFDSTAHTYAKKYTRAYEALDCQKGDVDGDGTLDTTDAFWALQYYASVCAGRTSQTLTERAVYAADYSGDGTVDTFDAYEILRKYARISAGYEE